MKNVSNIWFNYRHEVQHREGTCWLRKKLDETGELEWRHLEDSIWFRLQSEKACLHHLRRLQHERQYYV
jgi:hypothetical protein